MEQINNHKHLIISIKALAIALLPLTFCACDTHDMSGMFWCPSETVEKRFEQSMTYNATHPERIINATSDSYRIYIASDVHYEGDATNLNHFLQAETNDPNAICSIIIGDLVNRVEQYPALVEHLQTHYQNGGDTIFVIAGNHDLYYGQWPLFFSYFGASTYTMTVRGSDYEDLFILLETGGGLLGRDQLQWLANTLKERRATARHCTVLGHTNFFNTDNSQFPSGNMQIDEMYEFFALMANYNVDLCVQGHDHHAENLQFKGVSYAIVNTLKMTEESNGYLFVDYSPETVQHTFVDMPK